MKPLSYVKTVPFHFWITFGIAIFAVLVSGCSSKQVMIVPDLSMAPTLDKGEKVVANFLAYRIEDPQRGDLAIFIPRSPQISNWVLRVAAVPGDTLSYENGTLQLNNKTVCAPYFSNDRYYPQTSEGISSTAMTFPYTLKENEYFFLSDDPSYEYDSRHWGPIHRSGIMGKISNR